MADLLALFHNASPEAHRLALQSSLITAALGGLVFLGWWLQPSGSADE